MFGAAVPEAAVHEHGYPCAGEHEINFATGPRQQPLMQAIAKSERMKARPDAKLDRCVAFALCTHTGADDLIGRNRVAIQLSMTSSGVRLHPGSTISAGPGRSAPRIQCTSAAT